MSSENKYRSFSKTPFYVLSYQLLSPYSPTPEHVAYEMLKLAEAKPGELVVDLGCGDGNILIVAAKYFKCRCIGVEINPHLAEIAIKRAKKEGVADLITIIVGDFFEVNVKDADVIALYLLLKTLHLLKYKLIREIKPNARIFLHDYSFDDITPSKVIDLKSHSSLHTHRIFLYYAKDLKSSHKSSPT
mgnify:CR=1 FL=1